MSETSKTVVIAGSASLQDAASRWISYWEQLGYCVLDYPKPIPETAFLDLYPSVFESFFDHLKEADVVFIMNEDKKSVEGYIGAETFAELAYAVYLRTKTPTRPRIIVMKRPAERIHCSDELDLWSRLGWIEFLT